MNEECLCGQLNCEGNCPEYKSAEEAYHSYLEDMAIRLDGYKPK